MLWNSGEENFILGARTWRAVGSITPSATTVGAAFSPNGRQLAVLSNFGAQLYDVAEMGASRPPLVSGPVRTMNGPQISMRLPGVMMARFSLQVGMTTQI